MLLCKLDINNDTLDFFDKLVMDLVFSQKRIADAAKDAKDLWSAFSKSVKRVDHNALLFDEMTMKWYDGVRAEAWRDIPLFSGIEVLRIHGLCLPDFGSISALPELRVAEFVETEFEKSDGIEDLLKLEQVSCRLD